MDATPLPLGWMDGCTAWSRLGDDPCRHAVMRVLVRSAGDKLGVVVEDVVRRDCAQHIERRRLPARMLSATSICHPAVRRCSYQRLSGAAHLRPGLARRNLGSARHAAKRCFSRRQRYRLRTADRVAYRTAERHRSDARNPLSQSVHCPAVSISPHRALASIWRSWPGASGCSR